MKGPLPPARHRPAKVEPTGLIWRAIALCGLFDSRARTAPACSSCSGGGFFCPEPQPMAPAVCAAAATGRVCSATAGRRRLAARASGAAGTWPPQVSAAATDVQPSTQAAALPLSRRGLLGGAAAAAAVAVSGAGATLGSNWVAPPAAEAVELAPLGPVERVGGDKLSGLTPDQVKASWVGMGEFVLAVTASQLLWQPPLLRRASEGVLWQPPGQPWHISSHPHPCCNCRCRTSWHATCARVSKVGAV